MLPDKLNIRHCMLRVSLKKRCHLSFLVYGDLALDVCTCQRWFARFSYGDFGLNDKDRPGRPIEANDSLFEQDPPKID
jgi:hypothetical protein